MLSRPMIDRIAFLGISWYAILIVAAIFVSINLLIDLLRIVADPRLRK